MTTIREIAYKAGVSVGTVSNVLNDPAIVSPKTRERVLQVMRQHNYRPSAIARSLSTGQTRTFGLIVANIFNPFTAGIVQGAGDVAREMGCSLLIVYADDESMDVSDQVDTLLEQQVDGIFLATQPLPDSAYQEMDFNETPVVIMDRGQAPVESAVSLIGFDWHMAGYQAGKHLIDLGHRRIGFVGGLPGRSSSIQRENGFRFALEEAEIVFDEALHRDGDYLTESGYHCSFELLSLPDRPSALMMGNDMMALGAYQAVSDLNMKIPQDVSITGIDDNYFVAYITPPLTTVHVPTRELGRVGMQILLGSSDFNSTSQRISLPTELVVRKSTAAYHA